MPDLTPFGARALAGAFVLAALLAAEWCQRAERPRMRNALCVGAALLAVYSWTNFGRFHGFGPQPRVHGYELFHYQLGSKFFPELGYDGLYAASVAAQRVLAPNIEPEPFIRDLRSYRRSATTRPSAHEREVRGRFDKSRWRAFLDDHVEYQRMLTTGQMSAIRTDHGYNPTPFWTFVARLFSSRVGADPRSLALLASLDPLLLALAFVALWRSFGLQSACVAAAIFGTGDGWRYYYNGGALLRYDWLVACVFACCALKQSRPATAGACLAYASLVRLFPALLLAGLAAAALSQWRRGDRPDWMRRFAIGASAAAIVGLALGSLAGRGPTAWVEFAHKIALHGASPSPQKVSASTVTLAAPELAKAALRGRPPDAWPRTEKQLAATRDARRVPDVALRLGLTALMLAASARATPLGAVALGLLALFAWAPLDNYYWPILLLIALPGPRGFAHAAIALSVAMTALHATLVGLPSPDLVALLERGALGQPITLHALELRAANSVRYGVYSLALGVLLVSWAVALLRNGARRPAGGAA